MNNTIQVIATRNLFGKELRIYGSIEQPLFLAADVAEWIEYNGRTGQLLQSVDDNEKLMHTIYASGQGRQMWFLTENGLYEVLMQSRKPIAKQFKDQVKAILHELRINGAVITGNTPEEIFNNGLNAITKSVPIEHLSEYTKAYMEKCDEKIKERYPSFDNIDNFLNISVYMLGLSEYLGEEFYNVPKEEICDIIVNKLHYVITGPHNKVYLDTTKLVEFDPNGDILLTPEGFKELYFYFTDSKLNYVFKERNRRKERKERELNPNNRYINFIDRNSKF